MSNEEKIEMCGVKAHKRFRDQNKNITSCVCEPNHTDGHVYCVKVSEGIDYKSHALHYYGETGRTTLEPLMLTDMRGKVLETDEECAALWQYFEFLKSKRHASR